jgi:tRNA(fMet)-specific endonuclease VapC
MAENIIILDTSILIEYFRKSNKTNSRLISLIDKGYKFKISAITEFEIFTGSLPAHYGFWENLLKEAEVLSFDKKAARVAVEINRALKLVSKQIGISDLFIAATAISNNLPLATLNLKHFERIEALEII